MKLSHLSIAIFAAISLAACGGSSSSNDQTTPDQGKKPEQPEQEKPVITPEEDDLIVDPTQTGVVGKLDFSKQSSQGTTQYIRGEKSKFDRDNNPLEKTSATSIFGVDLNTQNPWFSNIALARLKSKDGRSTLVQYLGNNENEPAKIEKDESLQQQNEENVLVEGSTTAANNASPFPARITSWNAGTDIITVNNNGGHASRTVAQKANTNLSGGPGAGVSGITEQLTRINSFITAYEALGSLNKTQQERLERLITARDELQNMSDDLTADAGYQTNQLSFLKEGIYRWGDNQTTTSQALIYTGAAGDPDFNTSVGVGGTHNPRALGLVGINFKEETAGAGVIQGEEEDSKTSTRIFGRYLNAKDPSQVAFNSYMKAGTVLLHNNLTRLTDSYVGGGAPVDTQYGNKAQDRDVLNYTLSVQPMKLYDVQYGRVTGNLDPLTLTKKELEKGGIFYKRSPYMAKDSHNKKAVDTYFYRGTDATSVAEMNALPKGREMTYLGHALMYGIDNRFHGKVGNAVPSAFGARGTHGIGNFVVAKVDLDKERVKGSVYNAWQIDGDKETYADALVGFNGNIYGNTVLGEAQRTYNTSDKADFRASFFGDTAQEMGGSFNSTDWQERYGAKGDIWGGVFGATRVDEVSSLTNEWLGDIPDTTAPKKP